MSGPILLPTPTPQASALSPTDDPSHIKALGRGIGVAPQAIAPLGLSRSLTAHPITVTPALPTPPVLDSLGAGLGVLLWLATRADGNGLVGAGAPLPLRVIAEGVGSSRSAVKASVARLKRAGFLQATTTRHGLILRVRMEPFFSQPGNGPILIVEPDKKRTGQGSEQPTPGQELNPPRTTGQPSGPESSSPPDPFQVLLNVYRQLCQHMRIKARIDWRDRDSLLWFLRRHPQLSSDDLTRALAIFARNTAPGEFRLSLFAKWSEAELSGSGLSGVPENQNVGRSKP
ncbi:MAG: hypothetical protein ABSA41_17095 [Terriglobia bacterium]